ncbi:tetraspanin-1-like [Alosa sapidissima]|uniref:tetraspanin-1-like n=1 Tax=Alosa sapidissima TaxID=34773 RepID=UPI001C096ED6|nr:tetraspanin-1-like [Alosa sapidissima]
MGCFGFLKIMMFAFNGIIFLAGATILGVGIWVKVDSNSFFSLLDKIPGAPEELNQVVNVGYLLIAVGAVLLLLGFLGCCGAIKESKCMLLLFFIIVLLVFIAEVAGAVVILVFKPLAEDLIRKLGVETAKNIQNDYGKNPDVTGLWNSTMDTLKCCGFNNYTDFTGSPFVTDTNKYPSPCCTSSSCTETNAQISAVPGCLDKLVSLIDENAVVIIAVALGIAVLEISAMVVSMSMYCHIDSK